MVFRVIDNKLYRVKLSIDNEDEFIQKNTNSYTKFIKVNESDLPTTTINSDEVFYEYDTNNNIVVDEIRTQERANQLIEIKKEELLNQLKDLCDRKTQEALDYINEQTVTQYQLERYKQKEKMARAYLADGSYATELQTEADLIGMAVNDFANLVIQKANDFNNQVNYFISLIEAFRVKVKALILSGELEKADNLITKASSFDATTKPEDIKALFV